MKWFALGGLIALTVTTIAIAVAGCGAGTIYPPQEICEQHGGVKDVQVHYQGYPGEKQDTLCNDGFYSVEPE